jgi:hypothetical protein
MKGKVYSIGLFVVSAIVLFVVGFWSWVELELSLFWQKLFEVQKSAKPPPELAPSPGPSYVDTLSVPLTAQLVISAVLLTAALFVILTKKYPAADKHWAYGALGTVVGFWLKAPS